MDTAENNPNNFLSFADFYSVHITKENFIEILS